MPVAEKICLGVNLGTCEKYGEGEQPYDWAIAAGMYTPELDNSGAEVACGCGGVERNLAGVIHVFAAQKHHTSVFHTWCMKELTVDAVDQCKATLCWDAAALG